MKRTFDFLASLVGLLAISPVLMLAATAVWLQDRASPFYIARRVAKGGGTFRMFKLRSMVVNADRIGGSSTSGSDQRVTPVGRFIRKYKLDEFMQLWNVVKGDMSLVGPRPQVPSDASLYTDDEKRLLTVRPGITDLASIVFSDEGDVLEGSANPDLLYNQIVRPWKSRLALLYVNKRGFWVDLQIILLTAIAIFSRAVALRGVQRILERWNASDLLRRMASRQEKLLPYPPPGASEIVTSYP